MDSIKRIVTLLAGLAALIACGTSPAQAVLRIRLHSILHEQSVMMIPSPSARLDVLAFGDHYEFLVDGQPFATIDSKLLSTEMAGGFTGVTIGPYCRIGKATFQGFDYQE